MKSRQDYTIGICLLLAVVMLWTAGNFLTQVMTSTHRDWPESNMIFTGPLRGRL